MKLPLPQLLIFAIVGIFLTDIPAVHGLSTTEEAITVEEPTKHLVVLDEITTQELSHFSVRTPMSLSRVVANTEHHAKNDSLAKFYGISAVILKTELSNGDYINIELYQTKRSLLSFDVPINVTKWSFNSSYSPSASNREFKWTKGEMCIRLQGEWKRSKANVPFTLYYEQERNEERNYCPSGMTRCKCKSNRKEGRSKDDSQESDEGYSSRHRNNRCISKDLFCNGIPNCGQNCQYDELSNGCFKYSDNSDSYYTSEMCVWSDFDYLLMLIMTGLLFLLIPIVCVFIILYHRKFNASGRLMSGVASPSFTSYDGNNNAERNPHIRHIVSTIPVHLDQPPAYNDLPDEVRNKTALNIC